MQRHVGIIFRTAVLLVVAGVEVHAQLAASSVRQYRPFTARTKIIYLDDYGGETQFLGWFYRRSDGSYAILRETEAYGERGMAHYVADVVNQSYTRVSSFTRAAIVLPVPNEAEFRSFLDLAGTCAWLTDGTWKQVSESERLGIRVVEVEHNVKENSGKRLWVAPELECFPLLDLLMEKGEVRTIEEVLSVQFGEPDPEAFRVPFGFALVTPLEFEERWKKRFNGRSYYGDQEAQRFERNYQDAKARWKAPLRLP